MHVLELWKKNIALWLPVLALLQTSRPAHPNAIQLVLQELRVHCSVRKLISPQDVQLKLHPFFLSCCSTTSPYSRDPSHASM